MADSTKRILSHFPREGLRFLEDECPEIEIVLVPEEGPPDDGVEGEILLTYTWATPNIRELLARGVRWVHAIGAGVDRFPLDSLGGRVLTCARGASAIPIAEWTLAVMLAFEKRLPETWLEAPPERWNWSHLGSLAGRNLSILGLGGIGQAIATRALAFDMNVTALRRTHTPSPMAGVELVDDLEKLVADADHLVLAAPLTTRTQHILGKEALSWVKPGVHLVNIARGELVDQEALRAALDDERVAMASLDVATPEPLPEGHWLYAHPRVRQSAHVSWSMPGAVDELTARFAENVRRYLAGEPLRGQVNVEEGY